MPRKGEGEGDFDDREGLENPFVGFIEEGTEFDPSGGNIGGIQGQTKLT
jgi:hypothetical protein